MALHFACPKCSRTLRSVNSSKPKSVKCPHCAQVFRVHPGLTRTSILEGSVAQESALVAVQVRKTNWLVLGLSCLSLALAFALGFFWFREVTTPPTTPQPAFDESRWKEYEFSQIKVKVSLPESPLVDEASLQKRGAIFFMRSKLPGTNVEFQLHAYQNSDASLKTAPRIEAVEKEILADFADGQIVASRMFNWDYGPGMDFVVKTPASHVNCRVLFTQESVFVLSASGQHLDRHEQSVRHFLHSLRCTELEANSLKRYAAPVVIGKPK